MDTIRVEIVAKLVRTGVQNAKHQAHVLSAQPVAGEYSASIIVRLSAAYVRLREHASMVSSNIIVVLWLISVKIKKNKKQKKKKKNKKKKQQRKTKKKKKKEKPKKNIPKQTNAY